MSFLGGLGNFVQNIGPTAGAVAEAQAQGSGQRNQQALQMLALQRQQRSAEFENLKNAAEANKSNAEAGTYTPEYAGAKAGAEASAQQPFKLTELQAQLDNRLTELKASGANEMQIALARIAGEKEIANAQIGAAASRQTNQQTFEQAQQGRQQQFQTGQQGRQISGQQANTKLELGGKLLPQIEGFFGKGPLANSSSAPNPQQSDWDTAAQHLTATQPGVDPSTVLGPRP